MSRVYGTLESAYGKGINYNPNLVMYLQGNMLNDKLKLIRDQSNYKNNGRIFGAIRVRDGAYGWAFKFDGINDYVETPSISLDLVNSAFTFMGWVKVTYRAPDPSFASWFIVSKDADIGFSIDSGVSTYARVKAWVGGIASILGSFNYNEWHHIAVVYEGFNSPNRDIYIDGGYVATDTGGTPADFSGIVKIGHIFTYIEAAYGIIDEVYIYNRALSSEKIRISYNILAQRLHGRSL